MIVVVGTIVVRGSGTDASPDGLAGRLAVAAARAGSSVEVVTKIGDDPAGDELLLALARVPVGHVAVLRDSVHATPRVSDADDGVDPDEAGGAATAEAGADLALDAADAGLALRYLTDYRVLAVVHPGPEVLAEAVGAATWAGAHLVVITDTDAAPPRGLPPDALVVAAADDVGSAEAVAERLGTYAAAIDQGGDPAAAYAAMTAAPGNDD